MKKRVVVTGMSAITSLGSTADEIFLGLRNCKNAVVSMEEWKKIEGLNTSLGAPILDFKLPEYYTRKHTRSMGRVSKFAVRATEMAIKSSGLTEHEVLKNGRTGVSYGSCTGSTPPFVPFVQMLQDQKVRGISGTSYIQMMPHTTAVNIALFFGLKGRVIPTSSACTSGSQGIGYAFESIQNGHQTVMIAGGAEELCVSEAAVFDTLFATSVLNESEKKTPAAFDKSRDGLVLGEGAGTLILEDYDHALKRNAKIYAEIVGFATNCDAMHVTKPSSEDMEKVMHLSLENAGISKDKIHYINGHGTATEHGDIAESNATFRVFNNEVPFSALKSYFGHTLGACGAVESFLSIEMMRRKWFSPNLNLASPDPRCGNLDYITGEGREFLADYIMSNNFAFGGINTSLIFKRFTDGR